MSPTPAEPLLHPQPRVQARPPQEARDYEFVRDQLAEPLLAEAGVAVQAPPRPVSGRTPVGGRRRRGLRRGGHFITEPARTHPRAGERRLPIGTADAPAARRAF
ncbi:DUF6302 family protein, partial [Streptomyces sp. MnatMP-M17]|uniref:DUF6302 family protein n=1 Tax=Streptomyces sp. MnatMP-M17 TaxID=1839780 RepID=UPI003522572F